MTHRPSLLQLLNRSLPVMLDLASQIVFWTFEIMMVGRLGGTPDFSVLARTTGQGAHAIVAVGSVQLVILITITVLLTFVVGSVVSINRLLGAGRCEEANHYLGQAVIWSALASVIVLAIWNLGANFLASLLIGAGSGPARIMMAEYLRTLSFFAPLLVLNFVLLGILRGIGDGRLSMFVNIAVNGLHFVGAFLLIFGLAGLPALGVKGSALAGGVAHSLGAAATLILILKGRSRLGLHREDLTRMVPHTSSRLFRQGLPMTIEQFTWGMGLAVLLGVATRLGTHSAAAHISLLTLQRISTLIFWGLGIAAMSTIGQQHGAGRDDLARETARRLLRLGLGAAALLAALFVLFPSSLIRLFTPDPEVVELGGDVLVLLALVQIPRSVSYLSAFSLRGSGDTKYPMLVLIAGVILFELGLGSTLALPVGLGLGGIWLASLIDESVRAYLVTRRFWRRPSLVQDEVPIAESEAAQRIARGA